MNLFWLILFFCGVLQLSTRLSEARNARALTNLVKEIDAKLGALVIKPKKEKKVLEEAEIKGKPETAVSLEQTVGEKTSEDEVVSREAVALADDAMVEEVGKKVSEAEIAENINEEGESKAQKLFEMDEFVKEGVSNNSAADLSERTETKAPEVVVMDEDKEEEKNPETRTNETRGVKTNDVIDEEDNRETKISDKTESEALSRIVMDKEENEEGAETKQIRTNETKGVETEVNDVIEEENNKETKISAETKSEVPSRIAMENEEGAETKQTRTNETRGVETEVNDVIEEENNRETKISDETKREAPSRIVIMDKEENEEGAETSSLTASASDEAEALSKSSEGFSKAQAETEPNFS